MFEILHSGSNKRTSTERIEYSRESRKLKSQREEKRTLSYPNIVHANEISNARTNLIEVSNLIR